LGRLSSQDASEVLPGEFKRLVIWNADCTTFSYEQYQTNIKGGAVATRLQKPFPKKMGLKKEPPQDELPHVPQREEESEEFINEYGTIAEAPLHGSSNKKHHENGGADSNKRNKS